MKKQFLLLALMIFAGVFLASFNHNGVKACGSNNNASGLSMKTCKMMKAPVEYAQEIDNIPDMFMNPFSR